MGRGYALDRCWVARPEALCETCRWFVEDTHPHFQPTIGRDLAERTSSYNKKHHAQYPCKTPGLAEGGATLPRTFRKGQIGAAMRTTNATAVMAAIALTQLAQRLTQTPRLAKLQPRW